jgi:tripartite-type tricarboxylate transporter receptor subunit TctC
VPAKTPQPVVSRLHQELSRTLHAPDVTQTLLAQGLEVRTMTPGAFGPYIRSEAEKWTRVTGKAGTNET